MLAFLKRLRDSFRRRAIARDFEDEAAFHLEEMEKHLRSRGLSDDDARREARREFGNIVSAREALREQSGFRVWDELVSDLRYGFRSLGRQPWFSFSVVIILAIGLASTAIIHRLMDEVFIRPLPVAHPEEFYAVQSGDPHVPNRFSRGTADRLETLLPPYSLAAYGGTLHCTVRAGAQPAKRVNTRLVNGNFFNALGLGASAGRLLSAADDDLSRPPQAVAVASFSWATQTFGSAEAAVGRELIVNTTPVVVVGVLPASFREISVGQTTHLWLPLSLQARLKLFGNSSTVQGEDRPNDPDWNREERISWIQLLVRQRPDQPHPAPALAAAWAQQRGALVPAFSDATEREQLMHRTWTLAAAPGGESYFRERFQSTGWLLTAVVSVMLLLVCINVSGLLLVRSMSRHREVGVRLALGAGAFRVLRLNFVETLWLAVIGGILGWFIAVNLLPVTVRLLAPGQDLDLDLGIRSAVTLGSVVLISAFLSALAPAFWIVRTEPLSALAGNRGIGSAPLKLGRYLVVAQFALAVALVAVAAALGSALQRAMSADPGFQRDQVLTTTFDASGAGYDESTMPALLDRLQQSLSAVPGVKSVSFAYSGILAGSQSQSGIYMRDPQARLRQGQFQHDTVTPGFFGTVGTPLLLGRDFTPQDRKTTQTVAIVNASFARLVFGDANPLGQIFGMDGQSTREDRVIVGVVADMHANRVREDAPPMFYTPASQWEDEMMHFMVVRYDGHQAGAEEILRSALAKTEPGLVFARWMTLKDRMSDDLRADFATGQLTAIFGACALMLAGIGIAGSFGYLVIIRQPELALRIAIGAPPKRLFRAILEDCLKLSGYGAVLGVSAALILPRIPSLKFMFIGQPSLGATLIATAFCAVTAVLAGSIPARRAATVDPLLLLRSS